MENLNINPAGSREENYLTLLPQIEALIMNESEALGCLSNVAAALRQTFGFFWVGFYLVKADNLILGPFQGDIACTTIGFGKGVCGKAWQEKRGILVPDVDNFPGHIACSSLSKSEIVVPGILNDEVKMVLDIDSDQLNDFSDTDLRHLSDLMELMAKFVLPLPSFKSLTQ